MKLSIHQPNFFPWMGLFEKIAMADCHVWLSSCQFEKGGYQNRFKYNNRWQTMPVSLTHSKQLIQSVEYKDPVENWNKIKSRLSSKRGVLDGFDSCVSDSLMVSNIRLAEALMSKLDIKTPCHNHSSLYGATEEQTGTDRLVAICKKFGADCYVSGSSGRRYMDIDKFVRAGITVEFQRAPTENTLHPLDLL